MADVRAKVDTVRAQHEGRALCLTSLANVNWRTGGLIDPIDRSSPVSPAWVVDAEHGSALITTTVEAERLADFSDLSAEFEISGVPWWAPDAFAAAAVKFADGAPSQLLSDGQLGINIAAEMTAARLVLSSGEQEDLGALGHDTGAALGEALASWDPGSTTDREMGARVSAALERAGATAVCLIVGGDERLRRFRHPLAVGATPSDALMVVVVARRFGLHVAATRLVVTDPHDEIVPAARLAGEIVDAVLAGSSPGGTWGDTLRTLDDAYAAVGHAGEWREHYQGGPIGFDQREFEISPDSGDTNWAALSRCRDTAVAWNPSLHGGAKVEDTYLIGVETTLLTATPDWPTVTGRNGIPRSDVLVWS